MRVTDEDYRAIEKIALANYEQDGNDYIVETLDRDGLQEIADREGCTDFDSLLTATQAWAKLVSEVESDIRGA